MFTGIVETVGEITETRGSTIGVASDLPELLPGESVCVQGVCLTVTTYSHGVFWADISEETLLRSTLGDLAKGSKVNLERALRADDRFGGHIVQGHVDGTAQVSSVNRLSGSTEVFFRLEGDLQRYVIQKGSIAIDGVSLTVARLSDEGFAVSLIPKTLEDTTLEGLEVKDRVNIEVDLVAKYVERLLGKEQ